MSSFPYQDLDEDDIFAFSFQFIKRPYFRIDTRMQSGVLLLLPNCAFIQEFADGCHQSVHGGYTEAIILYGKQLSRFVMHVADEVLALEYDDLELLRRFVTTNYTKAAHRLKKEREWENREKALARFLNRYMYINVPDSWSSWSFQNVVLGKYELDDPIMVSLPYVAVEDFCVSWDIGEEFEYHGSKMLSYLQKLEYIESEKVLTSITRREYGDDLCRDLMMETSAPLYHFKVLRSVPDWIRSMPLDSR